MIANPFVKIDGLVEEQLHPKFKLLCENPLLAGERAVVKEWVGGFIDRDNKIIKEFQTTFHSSFWEFYLFALLREAELEVDQTKDRPDFIVNSPYKFNIEAVVANIKRDGKPESDRRLEDELDMLKPPHLQRGFQLNLNEAITRYSNAIQSKNKLYHNNYKKCEWIDKDAPFVVALGSYDQINYGGEFIYPMMALLYGWYYEARSNNFIKKDRIKKPNSEAEIELGIFDKEEYNEISAIIFSCTVTLGKLTALSISNGKMPFNLNNVFTVRHDIEDDEIPYKMQLVSKEIPEYLSDGTFIFHNPNTNTKLPLEAFIKTNIVQVTLDKDAVKLDGANLPIVGRFNSPLVPDQMVKSFVLDIMSKYNGRL